MPRRKIVAGATAATFLFMAASACGSDRDGPSGSKTPSVQYTPQAENIKLPLDAYQISTSQDAQQVNLRNIIIISCMKSFGLSYLSGYRNRTQSIAAQSAIYNSRRYGISDKAAAQKFGYHLPPVAGSDDPEEPLSKDQRIVMLGLQPDGRPPANSGAGAEPTASPGDFNGKPIPPGGCLRQAEQTLGMERKPELATAKQLASSLSEQDYQRTLSDPKVLAVNEQWSACMAKKGYTFKDPIAAAAQPDLNSPVQQAEIQTAVADIDCKEAVGYIKTLVGVETGYQQKSIEQNAQTLAPLKESVSQQIEALKQAIETYGK